MEDSIISKAKEEEADTKAKENNRTMFKIRQEKKVLQTQAKMVRNNSHSKLFREPSILNRKVWEEFEAINNLK